MQARLKKVPTGRQQSLACREFRPFDPSWHYHPEYELTLIVTSRGRRFVGDSIARYAEGDLALIGPNLPHFWYSDASIGLPHSIAIQFLGSFLGDGFFETPEMRPVRLLLSKSRRGLQFVGRTRRAVAERVRAIVGLSGVRRIAELLLLLDMLARSREAKPLSSRAFVPDLNHLDASRVNTVYQFVRDRLGGPIGQPEAAAAVHMTPSSFSRFFKKATGMTFCACVNELRVGRACQLLLDSDLGITQICFACGYTSLSNFNRRFREIKGCSPRDFRREFARAASSGPGCCPDRAERAGR